MDKTEVLNASQKDFLQRLHTSASGLTSKQAENLLTEYGPNILGKKIANVPKVLAHQFQSSLIYLLIIAGLISYVIRDYTDGTVILVILLINTALGFFQEYKSEKIIEKLSHLLIRQIRVKRDNQNQLLDESLLVPGDLLTVLEGDIVPADFRLLTVSDLQVNESQLTGESVPVIKSVSGAPLPAASDLLFAGSVVEKGEGAGVVYATGKNTELGAIAKLSAETKRQTKYEQSLKSFSSLLIKITLFGLGAVFVMKLALQGGYSNFTNLFLFIVATAVAIVPEALPVIATVTLSSGALKLAKKHVVVRRLSALEDLGNVNLLCTDKTGTITENKMAINKIDSSDSELFQTFAYAAIMPLKGRKHRAQNSYDDALLHYVPEKVEKKAKELVIAKELPFDPDARRRRVVLSDEKNNKHYLVVIGAPEVLLHIARTDKKAEYLRNIAAEGKSGLHTLALAYKETAYADSFDIFQNEHGLTFLGYASFEDPLRPTAKYTIERAEKLGIQVKVLTGDSCEVAQYVGRQIGLLQEKDSVYSGDELEKMSAQEFQAAVRSSHIFARVSPTQKFNIIKALKQTYVVAYQGDGINDAPALKLADVAIAVNTATDIAKENADIVLLNKSLEVIINGIAYGRSIFVNINKYIKYTMVSNFGNFIALAALYLLSADLPLLPIQVLLATVIVDIPLVTVSSDTVEEKEVVLPEKHNVKELTLISLILGIPTALFELFYFFMIRSEPQAQIQTSLYAFITLISLIIFFAIRSKNYFWKSKMPSMLLNISFLLGFIFSFAIIYINPFQTWFSFSPLPPAAVALILILAAIYFYAADTVKVWYYRVAGKKAQTVAHRA